MNDKKKDQLKPEETKAQLQQLLKEHPEIHSAWITDVGDVRIDIHNHELLLFVSRRDALELFDQGVITEAELMKIPVEVSIADNTSLIMLVNHNVVPGEEPQGGSIDLRSTWAQTHPEEAAKILKVCQVGVHMLELLADTGLKRVDDQTALFPLRRFVADYRRGDLSQIDQGFIDPDRLSAYTNPGLHEVFPIIARYLGTLPPNS